MPTNEFFTVLLITVGVLVFSGSMEQAAASPGPDEQGGSIYEWDLNLPSRAVPRRISRTFNYSGDEPVVLAEIEGPGCIRRFWVTGANLGRNVLLRIYFDGEEAPSVEAPLNDFFGAMHNLMADRYPPRNPAEGLPDGYYRINTPFFTVQPKTGFTSHMPMPFAESARFEIVPGEGTSRTYYLIDWHEYPEQEMQETMRFRARWRREAPVRDYEDEFLMLDADGPGRLVGFMFSVDMLQDRHKMRWSHAGADNIYIDGVGTHPAYLRGIGGEDTFGASYSGGDNPGGTSLYADVPYYIWKDDGGDYQKLAAYRFFAHDSIRFDEGIHMRFASRAHDIASTVYWYSAAPVRPFHTMPPPEKRMPGTEVLRGDYDLPLPDYGAWRVAGPFDVPPASLPTARDLDFDVPFNGREWRTFSSLRGFVDFNHIYRPEPSNDNSPTLEAVAVARAVLHAPDAGEATLTLGWDDRLVIQVNDGAPLDLGEHRYFRSQTVQVPLEAGENTVALWLNNGDQTESMSRGGWVFSFRAQTEDGAILRPQAD